MFRKLLALPIAAAAALLIASPPAPQPFQFAVYPANSGTLFPAPEFSQFTNDGAKPAIVNYYSGPTTDANGEKFQSAFVQAAHADGVETFAELQSDCPSTGCSPTDPGSLYSIIAGGDDAYFASWAAQVKATGIPILATFDHEMNATWYTWGSEHYSAKTWIEAWNHVTSLINQDAPGLVTWIWTPNASVQWGSGGVQSLASYWSSGGVTVQNAGAMGLDYYFCISGKPNPCPETYTSSQTQAQSMAANVAEEESLSSLPVLIAETGDGAVNGRSALITPLISAIAQDPRIMGVLWFDANTSSQNYALNFADAQTLANAVNAAKAARG
jgi:hypothetical protein